MGYWYRWIFGLDPVWDSSPDLFFSLGAKGQFCSYTLTVEYGHQKKHDMDSEFQGNPV